MKKELRLAGKKARKEIPEIQRERKSHKIFSQFLDLKEFKNAEKILFYTSFGEEVVTHFMIRNLLERKKEIFVPKMENENILICKLDHWEDLEFNEKGFLEPENTVFLAHPSEMDLVVVPGTAFSPSGARLGSGMGHYDRLLKNTKAFKIGFAFEEQIFQEIPQEDHDVQMNMLITDLNIYKI